MTRSSILILGLTVLLSCKSSQSYHLPPRQMQQVLFDAHLAEAYSMAIKQDSFHRGTERNMDTLAAMYRNIFSHHKITADQFRQSLDWYRHHPEELDSIYTNLLPEFNKLEAAYDRP